MSFDETKEEREIRERRMVEPNYKTGNADKNKAKRDRKNRKRRK